ncbi:MAG: hypothetical protein K2X57_23310 [Xanthobacteraceae bacterium]|nr:hypothetical protein [Xanthobacteraceae bacterium]
MRVPAGIILSLLAALIIVQTTANAYADKCPPNCEPDKPTDKGTSDKSTNNKGK